MYGHINFRYSMPIPRISNNSFWGFLIRLLLHELLGFQLRTADQFSLFFLRFALCAAQSMLASRRGKYTRERARY
jgi:hypothetical protein